MNTGGEHAITSPLVRAHLERWPSLAVLQIDAHADLRDSYEGLEHSQASALRRVVEMLSVVHVGIRNISSKSSGPSEVKSKIFYMKDIEKDPEWFVKVVDVLAEHVYSPSMSMDWIDPSCPQPELRSPAA